MLFPALFKRFGGILTKMIDGLPGLTVKSHLTNFSSSSGDLDVTNRMYVIESFRVMFTALGITIGIVGICFNTALIISSTIMNSMLATFSLKTRNLIISLAAADIFLLVFGTKSLIENVFSCYHFGFIL